MFAHRDADAPGTEIERENGPASRGGSVLRRRHASRVPDSVGQSREVDAEQLHRRRQARLGGFANSTSGSAATVSQAF